MSGRFGARNRAYVLTDLGRRYLRMVDAGLEQPVSNRKGRETCGRGHRNWYVRPNGTRYCRVCSRERTAA